MLKKEDILLQQLYFVFVSKYITCSVHNISNQDQTPSSKNSIYCRKETDNIKVKYYYYLLLESKKGRKKGGWEGGRKGRRKKKRLFKLFMSDATTMIKFPF